VLIVIQTNRRILPEIEIHQEIVSLRIELFLKRHNCKQLIASSTIAGHSFLNILRNYNARSSNPSGGILKRHYKVSLLKNTNVEIIIEGYQTFSSWLSNEISPRNYSANWRALIFHLVCWDGKSSRIKIPHCSSLKTWCIQCACEAFSFLLHSDLKLAYLSLMALRQISYSLFFHFSRKWDSEDVL
jgi:hypothetical protein